MDSDDSDQFGKKLNNKKSKGRKKSVAKTKVTKKLNITKISKSKKTKKDSDSDDECFSKEFNQNKKIKLEESKTETILFKTKESFSISKKLDLDKIVDLPTPSISFTTATSRLNVPLHENKPLNWNHKINLIGEKSLTQRVYLCELCNEPILFYGRLIPCKHVFCFDCANEIKESNCCLRCKEKILRIEKSSLTTTHICSNDKCKRTYLSQRDLLAHIQHRHTKKEKSNSSSEKSLKMRSSHSSNQHSYNNSLISDEQIQQRQNSHFTSQNYPQPSLHTLQWASAVAAASSNAASTGKFIPPNIKFSATSTPTSGWPNSNKNYYP